MRERQQLRYLLPGAGDWISKPDLTYLDECLRDFGSNTGRSLNCLINKQVFILESQVARSRAFDAII